LKVLFLDIDGVLNYLGFSAPKIHPDKVRLLNKFLDKYPELQVVISSSWRFIVNRGDINLDGLRFLFRTHGIDLMNPDGTNRLIAVTNPNILNRGRAINDFLDHNKIENFVVFDDEYISLETSFQKHFVYIDSRQGLTKSNIEYASKILGE